MGGKDYRAFDGIEDVPLKYDPDQDHEAGSREQQDLTFGSRFDDVDSDDGLLDWRALHRLRKTKVLGVNVAPAVDFLTLRHVPGMTDREIRKRRAICVSAAVATVVGIIFIALLATQTGVATSSSSRASTPKAQQAPAPVAAKTEPATEHHEEQHHHDDDQPPVDWSQFPAGPLCTWQSLYLPDTVVPDLYNLKLEVPMAAPFQVSGHADVALNVTNATSCIVLHAVGINFTSVAIKDGDAAISGRIYGSNSTLQQVALQFAGELQPSTGRYVLHLHFGYPLQEGVDGLYLSKYHSESGQEELLVASQFESVAARKAFPCFDEPRFKAIFRLAVQAPPPPMVVLSNMPPEGLAAGDEENTVLHQFQATPYMSPYLLALVVGNLNSQTFSCDTSTTSLPVTAWGTPSRHEQLTVAPEVGCQALKHMEALTGVPFALPKLDLVAVPEFAAGAMENWGLIMYNEVDILVDNEADDLQQRFDVAATVAHEVTHQWFGDLVTCSSWSELWLNEGFATYFEHAAAAAAVPQYRYFDFFYQETTAKALNDDAMASSHPLTVLKPLASVGAVDNLFDSVMYEKGAAVLRMLRAYLARSSSSPDHATDDIFLAGLRLYLKQQMFKTATYEDLWGSIATVADGPVADWMRTWTLRQNYPLVTALVSPKGRVLLKQDPFTTAPPPDLAATLDLPPGNCTDKAKLGAWWIPLSYRTQASPTVHWHTFDNCHSRLPHSLPRGQYILANPGRYGFYRVNYQSHNWGLLATAAAKLPPSDPGYISDNDFAGLLDDSFRLSEAGALPITHFLNLAAALPRRLQPDVFPSWAVAKQGLDKIALLLRTANGSVPEADCAEDLSTWLHNNVTGPYITNMQLPGENQGITFEVTGDESVHTRRLRPLLLSASAQWGNTALVHDAATLLAKAVNGSGVGDLNPDVRPAIYRAALAGGSKEVYQVLLEMYLTTKGAKDKRRLLNALATAPSTPLIQRTLALAVSAEVRLSDMSPLLEHIGKEGGAPFNLTWEFLLANTSQILERYPGGGAGTEAAYSFGRAAKTLASLFVDDAVLPRVEAWADKYQHLLDPEFKGIVRENLRQNRRWLETQGEAVCAWLAGQGLSG